MLGASFDGGAAPVLLGAAWYSGCCRGAPCARFARGPPAFFWPWGLHLGYSGDCVGSSKTLRHPSIAHAASTSSFQWSRSIQWQLRWGLRWDGGGHLGLLGAAGDDGATLCHRCAGGLLGAGGGHTKIPGSRNWPWVVLFDCPHGQVSSESSAASGGEFLH